VNSYYNALHRQDINDFYVPRSTLADGKAIPLIFWNGNTLNDGEDVRLISEQSLPSSQYEVQCLDCQVMNSRILTTTAKPNDCTFSIVVQISGIIKNQGHHNRPQRAFSDVLVLVPNVDRMLGRGNPASHRRMWLIQSQNFRYVV
jgi:NTF2-related export protein 1/2